MLKKIIFMGTPLFSVPILKSLFQNGYTISAVYTQPPKKSHRGQSFHKSPIQNLAEELNINFRSPEKLKDYDKEYEFLKKLNAPNSGLFNKTLSGDIFFRRSSSLRLLFDEILFDFNDI